MRRERPGEYQHTLKFGAGLNTRASEMDIDPTECADGQNFDLTVENSLFGRRKAFDKLATAPNGERINGLAQLEKQDGTLSTIVQAGDTVYHWDGDTTFTSKGTVPSGARIRGRPGQNFLLDEVVIITDLAEKTPVLIWDGTTLSEMAHDLGGDFYARYAAVENERVYYANIKTSTSTPHLIAASRRSDYDSLSLATRPVSGNNAADPFFFPVPDLRYINGLQPAFGRIAVSTRNGRFFQIAGNDATDMTISQLYADSAAAGNEAIVFVDNDIMYGRRGHIESLFATETLGNVETDNISWNIQNLLEEVQDWILEYNPRTHKVFAFASEFSTVYTLHKSFLDEGARQVARQTPTRFLSPWSPWKTQHASSFQPTATMTMKRPTDGLDHVFFGDDSGNIYILEGSGGQDGGSANINATRLSGVIKPPEGGPIFDITGHIIYRKIFGATATITFEFGGTVLKDQQITVTLDAASNLPVYGGGLYYNNDVYYSAPFKSRFTRQQIAPAGQGSQMQVRIAVDGATDFFIQELQFDFKTV